MQITIHLNLLQQKYFIAFNESIQLTTCNQFDNKFEPMHLDKIINSFSDEVLQAIREIKNFINHLNVTNASNTDDSTHKIPSPSFSFKTTYPLLSVIIKDFSSVTEWKMLMTELVRASKDVNIIDKKGEKIDPVSLNVFYKNRFSANLISIPKCKDLKSFQTREASSKFFTTIASSLASKSCANPVTYGISLIFKYIYFNWRNLYNDTMEMVGNKNTFKRMDAHFGATVKTKVNLSWHQYRQLSQILTTYLGSPLLAIEKQVRNLTNQSLIYPGK